MQVQNTLHYIDWSLIAVFLIISLAISLFVRKKAAKSLEDFFLGGRQFPWYLAGISMVATTFAADTPLAVTELVAQHGISGNWLWWSFLFGGMLTTFFFAGLWRKSGVLTEVELIELRYSGKPAAILRGFRSLYLGLFMNVFIIAWVNLAMNALLVVFFEIPQDQVLYYTGGLMLLAAVYSSIGGLWGVALTDMFQFVIAMLGTLVLAYLVVNNEEVGGMSGLKAALPDSTFDFFPQIGNGDLTGTLSISLAAFLAYTTVQWWASWYPGAEPGGGGYVAQRMMSTRNDKEAVYATLLFQIAHYCIRPWPWILVGLASLVLYPDLAAEDKKLGYVMAMQDYLPVGWKGLLLAAFFAAYLSTISTQLNWGASYLVNDFYKRFFRQNADQNQLVAVSRGVTLLLAFLGILLTTQLETISGVWTFIIECGAGLGLVLILRWYWWRINAWSEISATAAPFIAYAFSKFYLGWEFPESFFLTVGFTTVVWILVTFLTRPTEAHVLQHFYNKVEPAGYWGAFEKTDPDSNKASVLNLFICWISAIVLTYGSLFFIGKILFAEWQLAGMYGGLVLLSFLVLRNRMKFIRLI
ncbi:MAG: sodium:solute symporter family protein [Chitinophagales bacterium]